MALLDLWRNDRAQLTEKHVQQVIAFAGDGKLRDGSTACDEFGTIFVTSRPTYSLDMRTTAFKVHFRIPVWHCRISSMRSADDSISN
jgi:hypothetical protein